MNWSNEAIGILRGAQANCTTKEESIRYVSVSILEVIGMAGISIHDITQLIHDIIQEIDYPVEEETEPEEPIIEVGSNGVFDS